MRTCTPVCKIAGHTPVLQVFSNPIEMLWHQLKDFLRAVVKPSIERNSRVLKIIHPQEVLQVDQPPAQDCSRGYQRWWESSRVLILNPIKNGSFWSHQLINKQLPIICNISFTSILLKKKDSPRYSLTIHMPIHPNNEPLTNLKDLFNFRLKLLVILTVLVAHHFKMTSAPGFQTGGN